MAVYAKPTAGGQDITAGKSYLVIKELNENLFVTADDVGFEIFALWEGSCHIDGNDWERVESEDTKINDTPLATQIAALPIIQQIEIMQEVAAGKAFGGLSYVYTGVLDSTLDVLRLDAIDQAAAENDELHGKEVSQLTPWISRSGLTVGY